MIKSYKLNHRSRGAAIVYITLIMVVVCGFVSLGVDLARVQLAKTQLQMATDQAGKYGVKYIPGGAAGVKSHAITSAAENTVDGSALVLQSGDVVTGNYNSSTKKFTAGGSPANAVQINAARSSARGTAIPLYFGKVIGLGSVDIHSSATYFTAASGMIAYSNITFKNNTKVASYDPTTTVTPTWGTAHAFGALSSNGTIGEGNNGTVSGDVILGPSGSVDPGFSISDGVIQSTTALTVPADPPWNPTTNPGGIAQNYTNSSSTAHPAGTYWFTNLVVNSTLNFSGPATLYINGSIDQNASINAYLKFPSNLKIYILGANRTWDAGGNNTYAWAYGSHCAWTTKNNTNYYGLLAVDSITTKNNCNFYCDETDTTKITTKMVK